MKKKIVSLLFFIITITINCFSQSLNDNTEYFSKHSVDFLLEYLDIKYPDNLFNNFIYIGIKRQQLNFLHNGVLLKSYKVSTSKFGAGVINNSNMTPIGLHKIEGKFGDNVPFGGIMKYKKYTGEVATIETKPVSTDMDIISSRIITIKGLEKGLNPPVDILSERMIIPSCL